MKHIVVYITPGCYGCDVAYNSLIGAKNKLNANINVIKKRITKDDAKNLNIRDFPSTFVVNKNNKHSDLILGSFTERFAEEYIKRNFNVHDNTRKD